MKLGGFLLAVHVETVIAEIAIAVQAVSNSRIFIWSVVTYLLGRLFFLAFVNLHDLKDIAEREVGLETFSAIFGDFTYCAANGTVKGQFSWMGDTPLSAGL